MTDVVASDFSGALDVIFGVFKNLISALKHLHLTDTVSLFAFMIAVFIMGVVIAGVINIVHSPNVETSSRAIKRESKAQKGKGK